MAFYDMIQNIFNAKGITEYDCYKLFSSHTLTDEEIFTMSRTIMNSQGMNIFFTKMIGDTEIRIRIFDDIELDYEFYSKDKKVLANIAVNFKDLSLFVSYSDTKIDIRLDLMDYTGNNKKNVLYMRMQVLNELLTRYYSKLLYAIYLERRRRMW